MQDEKRPVRELSAIREDIDKVDRELVSLFCKRMELSLDVAESKRNTG
ncbi:MAG: chorismate mutase, partial [Ruminococcaceae bacterium]|nr:chorismate mutase [Oscillospiraceae bacterium]